MYGRKIKHMSLWKDKYKYIKHIRRKILHVC